MVDRQEALKSVRTPWPGFRAFIDEDCIKDSVLITPMRQMWHSYRAHCNEWGFPIADASDFVRWIRDEEGTEIRTGGRGLLRRAITGIAPKQK